MKEYRIVFEMKPVIKIIKAKDEDDAMEKAWDLDTNFSDRIDITEIEEVDEE